MIFKISLYLVLGSLFGFLLSRSGATHYDFHGQLFLLIDSQLFQVIATAVITAFIGIKLFKARQIKTFDNKPILYTPKPFKKNLILGAIIFGVGWGLTASCPGTLPAMLGEGKVGAVFTLTGIILGTLLYTFSTKLIVAKQTSER